MKIYGVGTDIVKCERIANMWSEHGRHFAQRILSTAELLQLDQLKDRQVAFLAKRFAAKEAIVKALGTGFRDDILITQIAIETDAKGKPSVAFYGATEQYISALGDLDVQISLADEEDYVVAFVIISVTK